MSAQAGSSFWRIAGMSYLQYINKAGSVVRRALKEPLRSQAVARDEIHFLAFPWQNGVRGEKIDITSISEAAKAARAYKA